MVLSPFSKNEKAAGVLDMFDSELVCSKIELSFPIGAALADEHRNKMKISIPQPMPLSEPLLMVWAISTRIRLQIENIFLNKYLTVLFTLIFSQCFTLFTGIDVVSLELVGN